MLIALPGVVYLIINNYIPMFGIFLAFKDYKYSKGIFGSDWCGLKNFKFLFATDDALIMTRNTILYNLVFIVLGTVAAIFIAILMCELGERMRVKIFQSCLLLYHRICFLKCRYRFYQQHDSAHHGEGECFLVHAAKCMALDTGAGLSMEKCRLSVHYLHGKYLRL